MSNLLYEYIRTFVRVNVLYEYIRTFVWVKIFTNVTLCYTSINEHFFLAGFINISSLSLKSKSMIIEIGCLIKWCTSSKKSTAKLLVNGCCLTKLNPTCTTCHQWNGRPPPHLKIDIVPLVNSSDLISTTTDWLPWNKFRLQRLIKFWMVCNLTLFAFVSSWKFGR